MKKYNKVLVVFALIAVMVCCFAGCNKVEEFKLEEKNYTPLEIQVGNNEAVKVSYDEIKGLDIVDQKLEYTHKEVDYNFNYKAIKLVDILKVKNIDVEVSDLSFLTKDKDDLTKTEIYDRFRFDEHDINKIYFAIAEEKDGNFVYDHCPKIFEENEKTANQIVQYALKIIINPVVEA